MPKFPKECRFCNELTCSKGGGKEWFRCRHGRFDHEDQHNPGRVIPCSFAWSGIWNPNKTVAAAQKDCPPFKLHPQVMLISKAGRGKVFKEA